MILEILMDSLFIILFTNFIKFKKLCSYIGGKIDHYIPVLNTFL